MCICIDKDEVMLFAYYRTIIGNTMTLITMSITSHILTTDITKSDNNNNYNNIKITYRV